MQCTQRLKMSIYSQHTVYNVNVNVYTALNVHVYFVDLSGCLTFPSKALWQGKYVKKGGN